MGVQKQSAMEENGKMKTLSNDLTRRLLNTSESLGMEERITVVDDYGQRMLNSGFGIAQSQKIVLNGLKDYERKVRESRKTNSQKLYRTALESSGHRSRKSCWIELNGLKREEEYKILKTRNLFNRNTRTRARTRTVTGKSIKSCRAQKATFLQHQVRAGRREQSYLWTRLQREGWLKT